MDTISANCTRYSSCSEVSPGDSYTDVINCTIQVDDTGCYLQSSIDSYQQQLFNYEIRIAVNNVTLQYHQDNNGTQDLSESILCRETYINLKEISGEKCIEDKVPNGLGLIFDNNVCCEDITMNVSLNQMQVNISFSNYTLVVSTDVVLFNCSCKS